MYNGIAVRCIAHGCYSFSIALSEVTIEDVKEKFKIMNNENSSSSTPFGLSSSDVELSRSNYGTNKIPDSEPTTFWAEFKETFKDKLILVLVGIAALMSGMYMLGYAEIFEPIGTIVAILIVAFVSAKTGVASDTKYRQLKDSTEKDKCKVYRNGSLVVIDMDDVVVGDFVLLQSGDKIPADGILKKGNIKVDNSALNGEAEECKKTAAETGVLFPSEITGEVFVDKSSLFRGAVVTDGEGILVVCNVGTETIMGKMAEEMQEDEPDSPLKVKLAALADQISKFGIIGAIVIALVYIAHTIMVFDGAYFQQDIPIIVMDVVQALSLAVVIIVCAVPEGLPLMIAIVLMQNTGKMLEHNVLVRKAEGIETAGSLNILFSDKTGTITKGHLEVVNLISGDCIETKAENVEYVCCSIWDQLKFAIGMNSQSQFDADGKVVGGNLTDQALMQFLGKDAYDEIHKNGYTIKDQQGFNSTNKFSQVQIGEVGRTYYKGAPERLLPHAKYCMDKGGVLQEIDREKLTKCIDDMATKSMRVLAFAYANEPLVENTVSDELTLIGLVGIRDDVRPEAIEAIEEVQKAGIQVVMITGDRYETAVAIAKDAGLYHEGDIALTSAELNQMSDDEVKKLIPKIKVIARALPTDKSRMVKLCQEMNLVVGMTGDGVNDSPALKRADVGFAMGSGTEAAKEAGKIVILDDNFRSIKDAILYGRTIYHNILKFCKFQLAINVTAVIVSALAPFFGVDEPLKVTHLLFVNLVMDSLGALMLGNEPAREQYMLEKPRRRDENIISRDMFMQIGVTAFTMVCMSFVYLKSKNFIGLAASPEEHLTGYFILFITMALVNGFNVRSESTSLLEDLDKNPNFLKIMVLIMLVQAAIVNAARIPIPVCKWISEMFSCVPVNLSLYMGILFLSLIVIVIDLVRKVLVNKQQ